MIPNYAEIGKPVPPSLFNRLVDAVRASQILTMVGGRVFRGTGGVSLTVDQDTAAGGGGGGTTICPFKVTDASTEEGQLVEVAYGEIAGHVPQGMVLGEPYLLDVTGTGRVYASIEFDPLTLEVINLPTAVSIFFEPTNPLTNTTSIQYSLIATILFEDEKIKTITNVCAQIVPQPCTLAYA